MLISVMSAFLLSLAILAAVPVFAEDFIINRFRSDITISDDSTLTVQETIEVTFLRPRHGIYREIPFSYRDELGERFVTPTDILSVTDEAGRKRKTSVENRNNAVRVRIGEKDRYVNGNQTYVILYRIENALLFFDDHDELYWNVTGNFWKAPIKEATANVIIAAKAVPAHLWASCYTGVQGSKESECRYDATANHAEFSLKRSLKPAEGFTLAFGWDKGLVHPRPLWKGLLWKMKENWSFLLPVISLCIMTYLWRTRGIDPRVRGSVAVMYGPPAFDKRPLGPAEVGALIDEKLDARDITSAIVGLAVNGYIKIEETKTEGLLFDSTDYFLSKLKEPDEGLGLFERQLMGCIFTGSRHGMAVSEMKNRFYVNLESLKTNLYGELIDKKYFLKNPEKVRVYYLGAALVVAAASVPGSIFITQFLLGAGSFTSATSVKCAITGLLSALPVLAFARVMPAKTKAGAAAHMDILGFQEFMNRAEKDRLIRMGDKDLFSKFLPYAIALDVVESWAKAFEGIYQDLPEWYVSPGGSRTFDPHMFSRSIQSMSSLFSTAVFSSPRGSGIAGSGFGGGGSSGGGFGGGGGGSW